MVEEWSFALSYASDHRRALKALVSFNRGHVMVRSSGSHDIPVLVFFKPCLPRIPTSRSYASTVRRSTTTATTTSRPSLAHPQVLLVPPELKLALGSSPTSPSSTQETYIRLAGVGVSPLCHTQEGKRDPQSFLKVVVAGFLPSGRMRHLSGLSLPSEAHEHPSMEEEAGKEEEGREGGGEAGVGYGPRCVSAQKWGKGVMQYAINALAFLAPMTTTTNESMSTRVSPSRWRRLKPRIHDCGVVATGARGLAVVKAGIVLLLPGDGCARSSDGLVGRVWRRGRRNEEGSVGLELRECGGEALVTLWNSVWIPSMVEELALVPESPTSEGGAADKVV
ncbi:hypothetical protein R3P38DRAFT_3207507 [Favolaschia claudopus]|uniref:Uncharacterized protein n=1 Tax=Favolaschia claudopus TaxID=2862362 RepID=A0AAW0AJI7_9AGAR